MPYLFNGLEVTVAARNIKRWDGVSHYAPSIISAMIPVTEPSSQAGSSKSPSPGSTPADIIATCKRRISELEEEIDQIHGTREKNKTDDHSILLAGRCIRQLVSLTDRVEDLVHEADRRACLDDSDVASSEEADRLYSAYKQLLHWQPSLGKIFASQSHILKLANIFKDLNRGADSARGDDAASPKPAVIHWLTATYPNTELDLELSEKTGRGFDHNITGRLLCPVDYNWQDDQHRAGIRNFHPDFLVTADSWPAFLYEGEKYDPQNPSKGLFKNHLLLKAFKHIFTSPSSALKMDVEHEPVQQPKRHRKHDERRTRSHLRFALSNCGSWWIIDGEFNYHHFYNNIIAFFEQAETPKEKKFIQDLLFWWNRWHFIHLDL
ncbi:hypothetical protein HD554DRAFT_2031225 [Boletus coccyginus]|nr:hypothetical protein HD554DRAFT_2031225 [Boletus coccyginus]